MNLENSLQFGSNLTGNLQATNELLNSTMQTHKINPHRITKQAYEKQGLSQKASKNIKQNVTKKRAKTRNCRQILKNLPIDESEYFNGNQDIASEIIVQQLQDQKINLSSDNKENILIQNLLPLQGNNESQKKYLKPNLDMPSELISLQKVESKSKKFDRFPPEQEIGDDSHNSSFEENTNIERSVRTPMQSKVKGTRYSSRENDYSDRETVEESISCLSDRNIGSQIKRTRNSTRGEASFNQTNASSWNSQENSYLSEKKEESLPYEMEFDQDFTIFSSNNTTPIKKQFSEESMILTENKTIKDAAIEDELANFKPEINPCAFDSDTINFLIKRESDYNPDPHFLEKKQTEVNWSMRAILLDWMMQLSMEFGLKRETFHYSINYLDRYLSAVPNVQKWELQLVGVTALYMASKVEEIYPPRVAAFAQSTDNAYTTQQLLDMEMKMLKALKWMLTPPSLNIWANWYMNQWDLFVERSPIAKEHPLVLANGEDLIQFKQSNQKSYVRFREMMQLIDCSILDAQTLQYKPRALIASIMYVLLGKYFKNFTTQQIFEEFPCNSGYLMDTKSPFNQLFGHFLSYSFGFQLTDLLPSIQYVAAYIKLPLNLELPKAVKMAQKDGLEGHFEEFLAYQTHHSYNIQYIKRRPRKNF